MVIPVGPPGAQHILKVVKTIGADGAVQVARSDIFGGKIIPFVPLAGGHQPESRNKRQFCGCGRRPRPPSHPSTSSG